MQDKIKKYFFDIKQAIKEIESFVVDKNYRDFIDGNMLQSAVERKLKIIG